MGVKNLWDILESCKKTLPLHHLQNKRVCIDLSCWMVQLQKVNKSYCAAKEKVYLRGLFHRLRALIALNCSLIFVTDGAIPAVKISTYRKRLNAAHEDAGDDAERDKISSLRRNKGSEFSCMIKEAKTLGRALGIPCLDGIEEAEAQCALLNSESICDGCFSSDSDVFLFGARTVYRDICLEKGGYVVCYEMGDIEHKLGLGRNSLIALALLLGSDYSHGVYGFGPESACQVIRSVGEDAILQRIASDGISFLKSLKASKKHGQFPVNNGKENNPAPSGKATGNELLRVVDAYMKPKCHSADSDTVYRALAVHPFQRTELQQICAQFFEWPPEKTDEYILPRIAERDLRRFANLRSSSSQLGVALPLHEMPVKCPIAEVLKHRRVVGKECFEVSWENFDGLKTSIVPADLVESACPEKIEEFEERRAQKKKQNKPIPRKKSEDKASVANVDQKLQQLLLDIEAEDNVRRRNPLCSSTSVSGSSIVGSLFSSTSMSGSSSIVISSCRSTFMSESSSVVDLTISDPFFNGQHECNMTGMSSKESHSGPPSATTSLSRSSDIDDSPCSSTPMSGSSSIVDLTMPDTFGSEDCEYNIADTMEMDVIDLLSPPPAPSTRFLSKCKGDTEPDYEPNMDGMPIKDGGSEAPQTSTMEMDVIDLLSPPQAPSTGFLSKCKGDAEPTSVIDLSGSDVEMSPEHAQKSKELRLFLASIRAEIS